MSLTPGVGGLYMTLLSGVITGSCALSFANPAGDIALTNGADSVAATWVLYPPLQLASCTQVGKHL